MSNRVCQLIDKIYIALVYKLSFVIKLTDGNTTHLKARQFTQLCRLICLIGQGISFLHRAAMRRKTEKTAVLPIFSKIK